MRIRELDELLFDLVSRDHPEIVAVDRLDQGHNRLRVEFASGAKCTVMVREVDGPGVPPHPAYHLPEGVL
ncbi:hypothetical protein [Actinokineospora sp.]|uniref:hypothetical protein n=1 Tax=Actinokineospora sp. TaxID=1872133 RepID=UPI00403828F3